MSSTCAVCASENQGTGDCSFCGTPLSGAPGIAGVLTAGTRLQGGAFAIGRVLGIGGFGVTYLGVDLRLRRLVAIKEFFPFGSIRDGTMVRHGSDMSQAVFTAARDRFLHEAQVAASFQHPGIVHVYTLFEENDTGYMVMELLRGRTLYDLVENRGPLPEQTAIAYISQVASALKAVHEAGFVHRDLKPDNIFLTDDGRVVLLDFGTAKELTLGRKPVTALVSPGYAPPEQYSISYSPDPRSDVYALAATLYHLLTGTLPVEAPQRVGGQTLPLSNVLNPYVSPHVGDTIAEAMALEPAARPASITDFVGRLRSVPPQAEVKTAVIPRSVLFSAPQTAPLAETVTPGGAAASGGGSKGDAAAGTAVPGASARGEGDWSAEAGIEGPAFTPGAGLAGSEPVPRDPAGIPTIAAPSSAAPLPPSAGQTSPPVPAGQVPVLAETSGPSLHGLPPLAGLRDAARIPEPDGFAPRMPDLAASVPTTAGAGGVSSDAPPALRPAPVLPLGTPDRSAMPPPTLRQLALMKGHQGIIRTVDFTPDGEWLLSGSEDKSVRLWGVRSREEHGRLQPHDGWVSCVRVSPDGERLATASHDKTIRLYDFASRQVMRVLKGAGGALSVTFSPDGNLLAGSFIDGVVILWDKNGRELARTPSIRQSLWSVAFSPDGSTLAYGTWTEACVIFWDVAQWREAGRISAQCGGIRNVAWSPDGSLLATTSKDPAVRVWDVATRSEKMRLEGHRGGVSAVCFHPYGPFLASAGTDKSIRLWDLTSSHCAQTVEAHSGEVMTVAFSRDGRYLASGSQDDRVGLFLTES